MAIYFEACSCPAGKCKSNIQSLLAPFAFFNMGNIWLLHYIHQLITNFVCLLLGDGQVGFFTENKYWLWLEIKVRVLRVNQGVFMIKGLHCSPASFNLIASLVV